MAKRAEKESARIAQEIIETYQPETVLEMQEAVKEIFGPSLKYVTQPGLQGIYRAAQTDLCRTQPGSGEERIGTAL